MPSAYSSSAAKNLPITIPVKLTGAVSSAWSVFCRFSSLNSRMVKIGNTASSTMLNRLLYTLVRSALFAVRLPA